MRIRRQIGNYNIDFMLLERDAAQNFHLITFAFVSRGNFWLYSISNLGVMIKKGSIH